MLRLIQNELIKIFSRFMWRVSILLILVLSAAAAPFLKSVTPEYSSYPDINSVDYHQSQYESYKQSYDSAEEGSLNKAFAKAKMETEKYFIDNNVNTDGWKREYARLYSALKVSDGLLSAVQQGHSLEESYSFFTNYETQGFFSLNVELRTDYETEAESYYYLSVISFSSHSMSYDDTPFKQENIPLYLEDTRITLSKVDTFLSSGKKELAQKMAEETRQTLIEEQKTLEAAKAVYDRDGSNRHDYDIARNRCDILEITAQCWEKFGDCDEKNEERIISMIEYDLDRILTAAYSFAGKDKSNFINGEYYAERWGRPIAKFSSYEQYIEQYAEKAREDYISTAKTILYCIENQVFPYESVGISTRESFDGILSADVYMVMFFTVFLAAVILSSEFSSGAIRLLVIRPHARWQLMLSKLLAVVIFSVSLLVIAGLLSLLTTVMTFGWGDMSEPYIEATASGVQMLSPIVYSLRNALTDCLSAFSIAAFAFFIATLFKRGIFAIAISVLIFAFGKLISMISQSFLYIMPFLKYTAIPYTMNLNAARYDVFDRINNWYNPIAADYGLSIESGIIITLLTTAIWLGLSFVIFDRQQINN